MEKSLENYGLSKGATKNEILKEKTNNVMTLKNATSVTMHALVQAL